MSSIEQNNWQLARAPFDFKPHCSLCKSFAVSSNFASKLASRKVVSKASITKRSKRKRSPKFAESSATPSIMLIFFSSRETFWSTFLFTEIFTGYQHLKNNHSDRQSERFKSIKSSQTTLNSFFFVDRRKKLKFTACISSVRPSILLVFRLLMCATQLTLVTKLPTR